MGTQAQTLKLLPLAVAVSGLSLLRYVVYVYDLVKIRPVLFLAIGLGQQLGVFGFGLDAVLDTLHL